MKDKAAMMDALAMMSGKGAKSEYSSDEGKIPPHEVTCPNCGHEWTMGEEEYKEDEEDESED